MWFGQDDLHSRIEGGYSYSQSSQIKITSITSRDSPTYLGYKIQRTRPMNT